jgi:TPR repeat protein
LVVPPLNLSVRVLDRFSDAVATKFESLTALLRKKPRLVNYAWMGVWVGLFAIMMTTGFLVKGKDHPGSHPEYWAHVCQQGRASACATWVNMLKGRCQDDSAAECAELGKVLDEGRYATRDEAQAGISFGRACDLGLKDGCAGLITFMRKGGSNALAVACDRGDGASCFLLGSLFSGGAGVPKNDALAFELFQRSCESGWWRACGRLGMSYLTGQGTTANPGLAIANFEKGCQGQNAASCLDAAQLYRGGKLGWKAEALARQRSQQACDLGLQAACQENAKAILTPGPH